MKNFYENRFLKGAVMILFILSGIAGRAQYISLPDTAFAHTLDRYGYSSCLSGSDQTGWYLDTNCAIAAVDTGFYIAYTNIRDLTGVQYFRHLKEISCTDSRVMTLPALPDSLERLTFLDDSLSSLPPLPPTLTFLECGSNPIRHLPALPQSLRVLWVTGVLLDSLPALPASLIELDCSGNFLSSLPVMPTSLHYLDCAGNNFDTLPPLPASLKVLHCEYNRLHRLPALPDSLRVLSCAHNFLDSLPAFDPALDSLACGYNPLYRLPALPSRLSYLACDSDRLSSLPPLPPVLVGFDCSYNSALICLPRLDTIFFFTFNDIGSPCLPNYPALNMMSSPPLDSVSLCDPASGYGCIATGIIALALPTIEIHPNPANSYVNLQAPEAIDELSIVSIAGDQINCPTVLSGSKAELNVAALPAGLYIAEVKCDGRIHYIKLAVAR